MVQPRFGGDGYMGRSRKKRDLFSLGLLLEQYTGRIGMLLWLKTTDQQGTIRHFSFQPVTLDEACAFLNCVVGLGHVLQQASIQEGTSLLPLPVEAFDGRPMTPVLEQLEASWQAVLSQPPAPTVNTEEHCIVYFSQAVRPLDRAEWRTLLEQSRSNNAQTNITGVLLNGHGHIVQVLEGEQGAVTTLFERIKRDRRHTQVNQVFNGAVAQRRFANWHMGFDAITARQLAMIERVAPFSANTPGADAPVLATISEIHSGK